jgi:hypothetical protein
MLHGTKSQASQLVATILRVTKLPTTQFPATQLPTIQSPTTWLLATLEPALNDLHNSTKDFQLEHKG